MSHFYIEKGQEYKFDILEYVIEYYNKLNAYIIFSAHGEVSIPERLSSKIDAIYWENKIDRAEIGRGHPRFCIQGFFIAKKMGFKNVLKNRAEDLLLNENQYSDLLLLLSDKEMVVSEQTDLPAEKVGDLFMFGKTEYIYNLWTINKWDYSYDGLYNLYNNFSILSNSIPTCSYIKEKCSYVTPQDIKWVTVADAWDANQKIVKNLNASFWGKKKGFIYYGGF